MAPCLISFSGKHYKYKVEGDNNDRGLAIGRYESVFLANLIASYLLEKSKKFFSDTKFHEIYHNDGFVVFNGQKYFTDFDLWGTEFQKGINKMPEGEVLNAV